MDGDNDDTDAFSVLTRLEEYSAAHEAGAACQAAAQWHLTKARRHQLSSSSGLLPVASLTYQASSLRQHDLAPQLVLGVLEEEPALEDEQEGVTEYFS